MLVAGGASQLKTCFFTAQNQLSLGPSFFICILLRRGATRREVEKPSKAHHLRLAVLTCGLSRAITQAGCERLAPLAPRCLEGTSKKRG